MRSCSEKVRNLSAPNTSELEAEVEALTVAVAEVAAEVVAVAEEEEVVVGAGTDPLLAEELRGGCRGRCACSPSVGQNGTS